MLEIFAKKAIKIVFWFQIRFHVVQLSQKHRVFPSIFSMIEKVKKLLSTYVVPNHVLEEVSEIAHRFTNHANNV